MVKPRFVWTCLHDDVGDPSGSIDPLANETQVVYYARD
jgi:hypothetical protein